MPYDIKPEINIGAVDLNKIIRSSLKETLQIKVNNRLRSSIFVSSIATKLFDLYEETKENISLHVIGFDEVSSSRISGESMLDVTIAKTKAIADPKKKNSTALVSYKLLWAVESEANTGLPAFAEDFSKLICSKSENYLYLNGLDQIPSNQEAYIDRRLNNAVELLEAADMKNTNFFFAFWPSPAKIVSHNLSYWDLHHQKDLIDMVKVFKL